MGIITIRNRITPGIMTIRNDFTTGIMTIRHGLATGIITAALLMSACGTTQDTGIISYDPPGATTETKPIELQERLVYQIDDAGIYVDNRFDGARINDFYKTGPGHYRALITPEIAPINWSSWYSFRIWADEPQLARIQFWYEDGFHRYYPKLSHDRQTWTPADSVHFTHDSDIGSAWLSLMVGPDTLYVSAQEILDTNTIYGWADGLARDKAFITNDVIGETHQGRPIMKMDIDETTVDDPGVIIVIGRQHPPEVPGSIGKKTFIETIVDDSDLSRRFREQFRLVVIPVMNPDGVDNGHWRTNFGGVDLNRDWQTFNQPENRAVRDELLKIKEAGHKVYYGLDFHSTAYDVFYTINKDIPYFSHGLTDRWLEGIARILPDYEIREEPFGVASPIAKNWIFHTFGAGAVTYEIGDETPRELIRDVAQAAATSLMQEVLKDKTSFKSLERSERP
jgi:cytosolic carboxypeptidase protein 6